MSRATLCLLLLGSSGCFGDLGQGSPAVPDAGSSDDASVETRADDGGETRADAGDEARADAGSDAKGAGSCSEGECCDAAVGGCGGCHGEDACAGEQPVCDDATGQCRGCKRDAECGAAAVCIEADGLCVADDAVAFVTEWGYDADACTRKAPCASLAYALANAGERKVFHVLGGSLSTFSTLAVTGGTGLVLDGEDTALNSSSNATLTIEGSTEITIEGFRFKTVQGAPDTAAITVQGQAKARIYDVRIGGSGLAVSNVDFSEVTLRKVHVGDLTSNAGTELRCAGAKMTLEQSSLETTNVSGGGLCHLTISRNRFESAHDRSVGVREGVLVMENNLVIHREGYNDSVGVFNMYPGSTIRFNTFVNTTALPSDGAAITCDGSVIVTSNVFAYNSGHPITGTGCETRYSVFDDLAQTSAGTGNRVAGLETLFVDRAGGDYHLAPDSKARSAAEPGLDMVPTDLEGLPRPADGRADSGAFEAP